VAQVVEYLPSKHGIQNSNPSTAKENKTPSLQGCHTLRYWKLEQQMRIQGAQFSPQHLTCSRGHLQPGGGLSEACGVRTGSIVEGGWDVL
jgi:hypothetical protein